MRRSLAAAMVILFLIFFLPWLWGEHSPEEEAAPPEEPPVMDEGGEREIPPAVRDSGRTLRVLVQGEVVEMTMEEYLRGVVRAEMPASFAEEALKAQAVAARTYTLYKIRGGGSANHPEADACDDINCCKAYRSEEEAAQSWGMATAVYEEKIRLAVAETDGEVVLYNNAPVLAVFHSSSAGATRPSGEVWTQDLPYLQSVPSPEGEDNVPNYHSKETFTLTEFKERFIASYPTANLSGTPSNWFTNIQQTENGSVTSLQVGGVSLSGGELRTLLGLRSAAFTISFTDSEVVFSVTGYGHGVGMSQYGANVLAQEGRSYREILTHYYVGTTVGVLQD